MNCFYAAKLRRKFITRNSLVKIFLPSFHAETVSGPLTHALSAYYTPSHCFTFSATTPETSAVTLCFTLTATRSETPVPATYSPDYKPHTLFTDRFTTKHPQKIPPKHLRNKKKFRNFTPYSAPPSVIYTYLYDAGGDIVVPASRHPRGHCLPTSPLTRPRRGVCTVSPPSRGMKHETPPQKKIHKIEI